MCITNGFILFVSINARLLQYNVWNIPRYLDSPFANEIYYFPINERLMAIIKSDLRRLLNYSSYPYQDNSNHMEDIYDSKIW